jgi:HEAT repeat protein
MRCLLELAHRLEATDAEAGRLAQIARTDPHPRVRLLALRALVGAAPASSEAARAVRHAYADADGAVRLRAAVMGGDKEGRRVLRALAAATDVPDDLSAEAIEALGLTIGRPAMRAILEHCPAGRPRTQEEVLRVLEGGDADDAAAIASALVRFDDRVAAIGVAILEALAAPGTEDALLTAAARADPAVRLAVAHALGAVGSARAVPVLHELQAQGGPVLRAAREAVVAVQARLSGASPGQLALASGADGRVAVAEHDGRVSLDGAPAARSED